MLIKKPAGCFQPLGPSPAAQILLPANVAHVAVVTNEAAPPDNLRLTGVTP